MAESPIVPPAPMLPLLLAAQTGDTETLARLLSDGADPNQADADGRTALMWAAQSGQEESARFLLKAGANVNQPGPRNATALVNAVREGQAGIIRLLLARGAETEIYIAPEPHTPPSAEERAKFERMMKLFKEAEADRDPNDAPAPLIELPDDFNSEALLEKVEEARKARPRRARLVMRAVMSGNPDALRALLEAGLSPSDDAPEYAPSDDKDTAEESSLMHMGPIDMAITHDDEEMVRLLLDYGANVNGKGVDTPLFSAVMRKNLPLTRMLLEAGADPNRGMSGMSPLTFAIHNQSLDIMTLLVEHGATLNAESGMMAEVMSIQAPNMRAALNRERGASWHQAVKDGDVEAVRIALDGGANVDVRGDVENTALMLAAEAGSIALVCLLLERGADSAAQNRYQSTVLQFAARAKTEDAAEIVALLAEQGAPIDAADQWGFTPLLTAAFRTNHDVHTALRKAGATVGIVEAAMLGEAEMVHGFVDAGVPIDARNSNNMTPLMGAAVRGDVALIHWLLEHGADVNARRKPDEETALHYAASKQQTEAARALLDGGADINARDGRKTPLLNAAQEGHVETVRLLLDAGASLQDSKPPKSPMDGLVHNTLWAEADFRELPEPQILQILPILLEAGADANVRNSEAQTPLQVIVEKNLPQAYADLFLRYGADVNVRIQGKTWLLQAVEADDEPLVRRLLDWNANINRGDHWFNPLDVAVARGNDAIASLLRERGAVLSPRLEEAKVTEEEKAELLRSYTWNVKRPGDTPGEAKVGVIEMTKDPIPVIKMKRKWDDKRQAEAPPAKTEEA